MSMFEDEDVIIIDDFDDDFDDLRNATVIRRGGSRRGRSRRTGGSRSGRSGRGGGFLPSTEGVLRRRRAPEPTSAVLRARPVETVQVERVQAQPSGPSLANLSTGEIIDTAAQGLAALTPLPQPPTATGDGQTDVENMIRYQRALAQHAKRDEQIRTIGSIAKNLWS